MTTNNINKFPELSTSNIIDVVRARSGDRDPAIGHVYMVESNDRNMIKIGMSCRPKKRIGDIHTGSGGINRRLVSPALMFYDTIEQSIHHVCDKHRRIGEWFSVPFDVMRPILLGVFDAFAAQDCDYAHMAEHKKIAKSDAESFKRSMIELMGLSLEKTDPPTQELYYPSKHAILKSQVGELLINHMLDIADACGMPRLKSVPMAFEAATRETGIAWIDLLKYPGNPYNLGSHGEPSDVGSSMSAIQKVADLVGYDLINSAWFAEPESLEAACPGLPRALNQLFTA